jgi:hypothetical protein
VHRTVDGGDHRSYFSIINNYFKPGPATPKDEPISYRLLKPESERSKTVVDNFGKAYVDGNIVEGNAKVTKNNWDGGVQPESKAPVEAVLPTIRTNKPYPHAPLDIQPADKAYEYVLANAGATLPKRDAVDERIMRTVRTGEVTAKAGPNDSADFSTVGFSKQVIDGILERVPKGIITHPSQVGGYPDYKGSPYGDSDSDGMPDDWEKKHGLNPKDPSDASSDLNGDGYTNIEDFINGLNPKAKKVDWTDLKNNRDRRNES